MPHINICDNIGFKEHVVVQKLQNPKFFEMNEIVDIIYDLFIKIDDKININHDRKDRPRSIFDLEKQISICDENQQINLSLLNVYNNIKSEEPILIGNIKFDKKQLKKLLSNSIIHNIVLYKGIIDHALEHIISSKSLKNKLKKCPKTQENFNIIISKTIRDAGAHNSYQIGNINQQKDEYWFSIDIYNYSSMMEFESLTLDNLITKSSMLDTCARLIVDTVSKYKSEGSDQ